MLKPLLFILTLVILIALALNFDFFSKDISINQPIKESTQVKVEPLPKEIISSSTIKEPIIINNDLSKEIQLLLNKAQKLLAQHKMAEALLVYEEIIEKTKKSDDIKVLKLFAEACFKKAGIHYMFPNYDIESTIESYELIISKFINSNNKELLLIYMQAKIQQAPFNSKDEILIAYNEVIEKFTNDKEQRFDKEIEELLFAKSFALMGVDDEEAIEVLDSIIAKYENKTELPETVRFSILNNIELSIITGNDTDKYVDLATQYMSDSPDTKPLIAMLNIIKDAQNLDQTEALTAWNDEYNKYNFPDWDFSELRKWVNKMETPESQMRISKYLDAFEKQKYTNHYQPSTRTVDASQNYSDSSTSNEENIEGEYQENPTYEPDPYINDMLSTEAEVTYPNPYSTTRESVEVDAVSHTNF